MQLGSSRILRCRVDGSGLTGQSLHSRRSTIAIPIERVVLPSSGVLIYRSSRRRHRCVQASRTTKRDRGFLIHLRTRSRLAGVGNGYKTVYGRLRARWVRESAVGHLRILMAGTASAWPLHDASRMDHALAVCTAPRHRIAFERYCTRKEVALECGIDLLD